jgi:hypothetical protein
MKRGAMSSRARHPSTSAADTCDRVRKYLAIFWRLKLKCFFMYSCPSSSSHHACVGFYDLDSEIHRARKLPRPQIRTNGQNAPRGRGVSGGRPCIGMEAARADKHPPVRRRVGGSARRADSRRGAVELPPAEGITHGDAGRKERLRESISYVYVDCMI